MQQENTTVSAAPHAITPKDPSNVSARQSISALIAQVNILLYIKIIDSSDKKGRCVHDRGLSYDEIIVIIVIIDIAVVFLFLCIAILKRKKKNKTKQTRKVCGIP